MSTTGPDDVEPIDPESEEHGFLEDEIVVPKGVSRRRFLLILALTIFVLLVFTVGDALQSSMTGGGGADEVFMTWTDPESGTTHEVMGSEFLATKRKLDRLWRAGGVWSPLNRADGRKAKITDEDVALYSVLEEMAIQNGVEVPLEEFVRTLVDNGWTGESIQATAQRNRMATSQFEAEMREGLRAGKLRFMLMNAASMVADPEAVVSTWAEENPQYTFAYLSLNASDVEKQAMSSLPDDEGLKAWYDALPQWDKQKYFTDERVRASVAWLPLDGDFDPAQLFEAYPLPEDWDADAQARSYYNRFTAVRFKNPAAEVAEGEELPSDTPLYLEFEEVTDRAAEEARIHHALGAFLEDMRTRDSDEWGDATQADLAAESAALGLSVWEGDEAIPKSEFEAIEPWGGPQIANMLGFGVPESFLQRVVAEENGLVIGRVNEKTEREEPEFATIRDTIAERWVDDNAIDVAVERLEALRDSFGERPEDDGSDDEVATGDNEPEAPWAPVATAEALAAAAAQLSAELELDPPLEVQTRGPLGRREYPNDDVAAATPADRAIVTGANYYELEPGQVAPAAADPTRKVALLVQFVGQEDPSPSTMKATELLQARQALIGETFEKFEAEVLHPKSDWFKNRYKLDLRSWRQDAEREANGEAEYDDEEAE